jgi:HD-GYP domain-containing protein (c-di-GMP phosphodiesterase class II)
MIGRAMGWKSPQTLFRLSVAGLLHDIGCKEIPREILDKPRRELNSAETARLEAHAVRSAEILSDIPGVPSDVIQAVYQHHENCTGYGYPAGLKMSKIQPMARVLALADEFCYLVVNGPGRA